MAYRIYTAVFQTALIKSAPVKVVLDPVKIEYFKGPRSLIVPAQIDWIVSKDQITGNFLPFLPNVKLQLSIGPYISITVRVIHNNGDPPGIAKLNSDAQLDSAITQIAAVHGAALFAQQIYRGRIFENNEQEMEGMFLVTDSVSITEDFLDSISAMRAAVNKDEDLYRRYLLMARFLTKSFLVRPSEEKFLYLWTILEIFPMKDTTNIKSISHYLSTLIDKAPELINEKLQIGKLFGARSNLVHNGSLGIPPKDFVDTLMRLESICFVVLRSIMGLPYSAALDKYFDPK